MIPLVIGSIKDFKLPKGARRNWENDVEPGEVESVSACLREWSFPKLIEIAAAAGYEPWDAQMYASCNFLTINGSVKWHTDIGSGINVSCLVVSEDYLGALPELITRWGALELRAGDVFVFNSNKGHAWVSQDFCALASITVRKTRKIPLPSTLADPLSTRQHLCYR
jgi:hypothetical protein